MAKKHYAEEFKEQLIKECQEVGNVALVARRHNISSNTIHGWMRSIRKRGSVIPLPRNDEKRIIGIQKDWKTLQKK